MGLSASQGRFLQLTARKSNIEFEAQQINFQRIQWSDKLAAASSKYEDASTNRHMMFSFNTGSEIQKVVLSYENYKNFMNQQQEGLVSSQSKYYLMSSSGKKIVVASEEDRDKMIQDHTNKIPLAKIQAAKKDVENAKLSGDDSQITNYTKQLADIDLTSYQTITEPDENGNEVEYYMERTFDERDFMIAEDLNNVDNFQKAIQDGVYYFANFEENNETHKLELKTKSWEALGGGAITEDYNRSDDPQAEAEYRALQDKIHSIDKKLELRLDQLESQREAIKTELESISKVIDDNVEKSFKTFG